MKKRYLLLLLPVGLALLAADQTSDAAKKAAQEKKARQAKAEAKRSGGTGAVADRPVPVLAWIYPSGGRRGSTVEVTLSGTAVTPETVLVSGAGVTGRVLQPGDSKTAKIAVEIAPDAAPGVRELRITNAGGVSNRFRFVVGEIDEVAEIEPNSLKSAPQKLPSLPVVVNGQILEGDRDYFQFDARAGQTIVCKVDARRLLPFIADAVPGWFDPVLFLYDNAGRQIQSADDFRTHPDPLLWFQPPRDGTYTIELRDVVYRGRGDFVYRLTIGAVPEVTHLFPLGGQRGTPVPVQLYGPNLAQRLLTVTVPDDGTPALRLTPNQLPFAISAVPSLREKEDNDTEALAQRVTAPVVIDGRIGKPGDSDYYGFRAKKNERLVFEVQARRLESPLDSILTLYGANHAVLAENDDWVDPMHSVAVHHADSRILYTFRNDGEYFVRVRDIQGKGGEEYAYRLTIAPPHPDFHLRISPDNPQLSQGDTAAITVSAIRQDEFSGDIQLSVADLPEGFEASAATIPAGQNEGRLTITAPMDAALGILSPSIYGTAITGKDTVRRKAESAEAVMQAFASTHLIPTEHLFLAVIQPSAFRLTTDLSPAKIIELKPDTETPLTIKILRQNGVTGGVAFAPIRIANGAITTKSVVAPPGQQEATIVLTVTKDAKPGLRQNVIISGVMRAGASNIARYAKAIPIQIMAP